MGSVRETSLPGVGVRHDFTTDDGQNVGVLVHRDGRREIMVYDRNDPDVCSSLLSVDETDARTLSELLGASQVTEAIGAVRQQIEGLAIEWIDLPASSFAVDKTITEGMYRTRTGASIVAVIRGETSVPAPSPEFRFAPGDIVVAVGTTDGLEALATLMRST